jgi:hypothetical protein
MRACAPIGDQTLTFAPCDLMFFIDNKGALCSSKWLLRAAFYKQRIPGKEITKSVPLSGPEGQFPVLCLNPVCRWPLYTSEPWCVPQTPKMKTWQTALSGPFPHSEVTIRKWGSGRYNLTVWTSMPMGWVLSAPARHYRAVRNHLALQQTLLPPGPLGEGVPSPPGVPQLDRSPMGVSPLPCPKVSLQ